MLKEFTVKIAAIELYSYSGYKSMAAIF